jgi:hypothetical protein
MGSGLHESKFCFLQETTMPSNDPSSAQNLNSADLAFIDAAIAMHKATQMKPSPGAAPAALQIDRFIGIIQVVIAVVEVATFVYNAVKGRIPTTQLAATAAVAPSASLQQLIDQRNQLAKALGDTSVLK